MCPSGRSPLSPGMFGVVGHQGSCWVLVLEREVRALLGNELEVNGARKRPATSWEKRWGEGRLQRAGIAPGFGK